MNIYTPWPTASIEALKTMWADGYSASRIADTVGRTRNAVIGRVYRLGLPTRETKHNSRGPVVRKPPRQRKKYARRALPPRRHEPTKNELRAMLTQAVENTARLA